MKASTILALFYAVKVSWYTSEYGMKSQVDSVLITVFHRAFVTYLLY